MTNSVEKKAVEKISKKTNTNHMTVSISEHNKDLYESTKELSKKIGCKTTDLIWFGLLLVQKNPPTKFGLS